MTTPDALDALFSRPPELCALARAEHGRFVQQERFLLPEKWMLHFYDYSGGLSTGGARFELKPGAASLVPAGAAVTFNYEGPSTHLYAHFSLPSLPPTNGEAVYWEPDPRLNSIRDLLGGALDFHTMNPRRASVRLWEVLLALAALKRNAAVRSEEDRIMESALRIFHAEMAAPDTLRIADVARRTEVSLNTLARTFRRRLGVTPAAYLRQTRVKRSVELLTQSNLPIKAIACAVGLPDLQHFNKTIRKETGRSPRAWRSPPGNCR